MISFKDLCNYTELDHKQQENIEIPQIKHHLVLIIRFLSNRSITNIRLEKKGKGGRLINGHYTSLQAGGVASRREEIRGQIVIRCGMTAGENGWKVEQEGRGGAQRWNGKGDGGGEGKQSERY